MANASLEPQVQPPVSDARMALTALGCAALVGLILVLLEAMAPFGAVKPPPDWAAIWTMRWSAFNAAATGLSAVAIVISAFYAYHTINTNVGMERTRRSVDLVREYRELGVKDALARSSRDPLPQDGYSNDEFRADLKTAVMYWELCAMQYRANIVDRKLLLDFLDAAAVESWLRFKKALKNANREPGEYALLLAFARTAQANLGPDSPAWLRTAAL